MYKMRINTGEKRHPPAMAKNFLFKINRLATAPLRSTADFRF